jgi:hypothetical protein
MGQRKHPCPACGYCTLPDRYDWDICPVCFWEDDVLETNNDPSSPANHGMLLSDAQANFLLYGAVTLDMKKHVRPPTPDEGRDPNWKPLPRAQRIILEAMGHDHHDAVD